MAKKTKSKDGGYVPFSREDINLGDDRNTRAEELFLQMLDVPKRVVKKKSKGKQESITEDDFYPTSMEETQKMEAIMMDVEAAIDDRSDSDFMEKVTFMKDVLSWSKTRHWSFAWWIIGCVFVVAIYHFYNSGDDRKEAKVVEQWTEQRVQEEYDLAIAGEMQSITIMEQELAKATDPESIRKHKKYIKEAQEEVEMCKAMSLEEFHKAKKKQANRRAWADTFSGLWCLVWIGLYIIAERPYGYMISKRRTELALYGGMRRVLFGVAGAMFGIAGAMQVTETVTTYTDGSKETDSDAMVVYLMKFGFLAAAVLLVLFIARIVIVIATVMGFIRNYDLIAIAQKALKKGKELTNKQAS